MSKKIQIRNVPEAPHRQLKVRAATADMSLPAYLLDEIRRIAERPTVEELRERIGRRSTFTPSVSPAQAVRPERGSR